jgi:uncharacterized protein DUF4412
MRRLAMLFVLPAFATAPLAAQGFEGTIVMQMANAGTAAPIQLTYVLKGEKTAVIFSMNEGAMAGKQMRVISDTRTQKKTMLVPMDGMGASKGMMMTMDMDKIAAEAPKGPPPDIKDLGTSETIAGFRCENYAITQKTETTTVCISRDLGTFAYPSNPMSKGAPPSWLRVFGDKPGFPMKVTTSDGKGTMQVVSVKKGSVPADAFTIPDGYMDASGMAGMMGRGGRGGGL